MRHVDPPRKLSIAHGANLELFPDAPATVCGTLAARIAENPDGVLRTHRIDGNHRAQSYRQVWRRSAHIAAGLRRLDLKAGRPVVLLIEDQLDFTPAFWACLRGGLLAVPLGSAAREAGGERGEAAFREMLSLLHDPIVVADEHFSGFARTITRDHPARFVSLSVLDRDEEFFADDAAQSDPLILVPTSGSTGRLKFVALSPSAISHRTFAVTSVGARNVHHFLGTFPVDSTSNLESCFLNHRSWTHMPPAVLAARPQAILEAIAQLEISAVSTTNSIAARLVAATERAASTANLGSLRWIGIGAETVVRSVVEQLDALLVRHGAQPQTIRAGYGTTETGSLLAGANPLAAADGERPGVSLGGPAPGVGIRIVGDGDQILAEGQVGDVQAQCPQKIFSGYWGEPDASRECFTADGWWRTGDLGALHKGELTLHGRAKEIFIANGKKIALADIDAELQGVLAAGDRAFSCAIHRPGEAAEQLAIAFVAGSADPDRERDIAGRIRHAVARRFGLRASPVIAIAREMVPLTATGKLRRAELAALLLSGPPVLMGQSDLPSSDRTPQTADIARRLPAIWRELLNIDGPIDRDADFFDLGGDSLRAVMLQAMIEEAFQKTLPAEEFFAAPTFANLLRLLESEQTGALLTGPAADAGTAWPLPAALRNRLLAALETWTGDRPTRERMILGYNTSGAKPPVFWVFNDMHEPLRVARMFGADQPLYAFRSGIGISDYSEDEIQALALRYVSEITAVCPAGPLFVAGTCQGSIIALAIAQHLLRRQRHVPLLILMDWGFPLQSYAGRVLLMSGREDAGYNHALRFRHPELSLQRAFADYSFMEFPGDHADIFLDENIGELRAILIPAMQEALTLPPRMLPQSAYQARIAADAMPTVMPCGDCVKIAVTVENISPVIWDEWSRSGLMLGSRWFDQAGVAIAAHDGRVALPRMTPGARAVLSLPVTAPPCTGTMQLVIDVVEEGNRWFDPAGAAALRAAVEITERLPVRHDARPETVAPPRATGTFFQRVKMSPLGVRVTSALRHPLKSAKRKEYQTRRTKEMLARSDGS